MGKEFTILLVYWGVSLFYIKKMLFDFVVGKL